MAQSVIHQKPHGMHSSSSWALVVHLRLQPLLPRLQRRQHLMLRAWARGLSLPASVRLRASEVGPGTARIDSGCSLPCSLPCFDSTSVAIADAIIAGSHVDAWRD